MTTNIYINSCIGNQLVVNILTFLQFVIFDIDHLLQRHLCWFHSLPNLVFSSRSPSWLGPSVKLKTTRLIQIWKKWRNQNNGNKISFLDRSNFRRNASKQPFHFTKYHQTVVERFFFYITQRSKFEFLLSPPDLFGVN